MRLQCIVLNLWAELSRVQEIGTHQTCPRKQDDMKWRQSVDSDKLRVSQGIKLKLMKYFKHLIQKEKNLECYGKFI